MEGGGVGRESGRSGALGPAAELLPALPAGTEIRHHPGRLILPGFIDLHIHFPQTQVIASYGAQLLEWLNKYTFVEEQKFHDPKHCASNARFFFDELLRNGTTTAVAFSSVHPQSATACFTEPARRNMLMIGGKGMMDRNAPEGLRDT